MDGLQQLTSLQSLWLGKNKIEKIEHVGQMQVLKQLDVQSNRLTALSGLEELSSLRELYLAHNRIVRINTGLPITATLTTIDLSSNGVVSLAGIESQTTLEELWMSSSAIAQYDDLSPLCGLTRLTCIYLEHSPLAADYEYRIRLTKMFPSLEQIDALPVNRTS